mmetsp:Transcript_33644/g.72751  ORF Transcript_33644/g.72751 Transcript_33644/m.72751 type:complete len:930 (+) Transcript_33644:129-2918(+)
MKGSVFSAKAGRLLACLALVLACLAGLCHCKLLAMDMGSDTTKIALVRPGRGGITLVTNEMSKRKTPTKVAFNNGARLFGESAAGIEQRYPHKVFSRVRDALGKSMEGERGDAVRAVYANTYRPYVISEDEDDGGALFEIENGDKFSSEELVGMLLAYFAGLGTDFAESKESPLRDIAIVIPSFFGLKERIALVNAGKIAGLNILGFINTNSAAAIHYAKDKDFADGSEEIIFYNMGNAYAEASLIRFSSFKDPRYSKPITKIEVVDTAFNPEAGSESFEVKLTNHFADKYQEEKGVDLRTSGKSMAKLKAACKKTKVVLSANSEAPINVESITGDNDLRESISRKAFEDLVAPDIEQVVSPLAALLEKTGVDVGNLTAVELVGGGSRVPAVQRKLSEVLGGRTLDRHLDGDEAAVMGAALFAANYSKSFVLKKMHLYEKFPFALEAEVKTESGEAAKASPAKLEFKSLPAELPVKVPNTKGENLHVSIKYAGEKADFPPGTVEGDLCSFEVSGFDKIDGEKYNVTDDTTLWVRLDVLGSLSVENPTATGDFWEVTEKTIRVPKEEAEAAEAEAEEAAGDEIEEGEGAAEAEADADAADAAAGDGEGADGEAAEAAEGGEPEKKTKKEELEDDLFAVPDGDGYGDPDDDEEEEEEKEVEMVEKVVTRRKKRKEIFALESTWTNQEAFLPNPASVVLKTERLEKLVAADTQRMLTEAAKNALESFILQTMTQCNDEEVEEVSSEAELESIRGKMMEGEDWLYEDGDNADLPTYLAKKAELEKLFEPVAVRLHEAQERPETVEKTFKKLNDYRTALKAWETKKPWVKPDRLVNATIKCDELEEWLEEKVAEQAKLRPNEDPILLSSEIESRLRLVAKDIKFIQSIKKPKKVKDEEEAAAKAKAEEEAAAKAASDAGEEKKPAEGDGSHNEL